MAASCLLIDILTKGWIYTWFAPKASSLLTFPYGGYGVFKGFLGIDFCIQRVINFGGAWGIFSGYTAWLVGVRLVLVGLLFFKLLRGSNKEGGYNFLVFISVGALANIIDYFRFGGVVDWIHLTLWGYSFPVFNIADMMISLGVILWTTQIMWGKGGNNRSRKPA